MSDLALPGSGKKCQIRQSEPFCRLVVDLVFGYNEITMALSPAQYGLSSKNKLPRIAGRRFPVR